jgi:hypothetical protein
MQAASAKRLAAGKWPPATRRLVALGYYLLLLFFLAFIFGMAG